MIVLQAGIPLRRTSNPFSARNHRTQDASQVYRFDKSYRGQLQVRLTKNTITSTGLSAVAWKSHPMSKLQQALLPILQYDQGPPGFMPPILARGSAQSLTLILLWRCKQSVDLSWTHIAGSFLSYSKTILKPHCAWFESDWMEQHSPVIIISRLLVIHGQSPRLVCSHISLWIQHLCWAFVCSITCFGLIVTDYRAWLFHTFFC